MRATRALRWLWTLLVALVAIVALVAPELLRPIGHPGFANALYFAVIPRAALAAAALLQVLVWPGCRASSVLPGLAVVAGSIAAPLSDDHPLAWGSLLVAFAALMLDVRHLRRSTFAAPE